MEQTNWERCLETARAIDKDRLIRRLLIQMAKMRKRDKRPLWSFVGEAAQHGSGVSSAICEAYGVDSDTGKPHKEVVTSAD